MVDIHLTYTLLNKPLESRGQLISINSLFWNFFTIRPPTTLWVIPPTDTTFTSKIIVILLSARHIDQKAINELGTYGLRDILKEE